MPRRKTPSDYHALAHKRGFRWLGREVPNIQTRHRWECEQGHQWEAIYNSIQRGTGCPLYAHNLPKTPEDDKALAEEGGFRWMGRPYDARLRRMGFDRWRTSKG